MKAERDRYKDTIRLLRDAKVKVFNKLTIAEKTRAENNGAMGKIEEDYNGLYDMLEKQIEDHSRIEIMLKYENQKLKVKVNILKAWIKFILLLIVYLIALLYALKSLTSRRKCCLVCK